jgi:hypothetical protein
MYGLKKKQLQWPNNHQNIKAFFVVNYFHFMRLHFNDSFNLSASAKRMQTWKCQKKKSLQEHESCSQKSDVFCIYLKGQLIKICFENPISLSFCYTGWKQKKVGGGR